MSPLRPRPPPFLPPPQPRASPPRQLHEQRRIRSSDPVPPPVDLVVRRTQDRPLGQRANARNGDGAIVPLREDIGGVSLEQRFWQETTILQPAREPTPFTSRQRLLVRFSRRSESRREKQHRLRMNRRNHRFSSRDIVVPFIPTLAVESDERFDPGRNRTIAPA